MEVRRYLEATEDLPGDAFETYDDRAVSPIAVHRRKETHQDAVFLLLDDVTETLADQSNTIDRQSTEHREISPSI